MKAANGVSNMYLAHEIAVDKDFRLEKQPAKGLRSQVEDVMRKAFWDVLQSQLNESPPKFKQALVLLLEIKEDLQSLLLPQHTKLKQEIEEILDIELVRQQADNGALDFPRYAQYVLSVMARLCAPVRDDTIRELTQTNDVVSLFRYVLALLYNSLTNDWNQSSVQRNYGATRVDEAGYGELYDSANATAHPKPDN